MMAVVTTNCELSQYTSTGCVLLKSRFMGSLDLQNWMHIGAMNL